MSNEIDPNSANLKNLELWKIELGILLVALLQTAEDLDETLNSLQNIYCSFSFEDIFNFGKSVKISFTGNKTFDYPFLEFNKDSLQLINHQILDINLYQIQIFNFTGNLKRINKNLYNYQINYIVQYQ